MSSADTSDGRRPIRRALVSVYDKTGLPELAGALNDAGVSIVSTGSSAKTIAAQGIPVTAVEDDDTVDRLTERIKAAERPQLVDLVGRMVREGFTVTDRKVTIP